MTPGDRESRSTGGFARFHTENFTGNVLHPDLCRKRPEVRYRRSRYETIRDTAKPFHAPAGSGGCAGEGEPYPKYRPINTAYHTLWAYWFSIVTVQEPPPAPWKMAAPSVIRAGSRFERRAGVIEPGLSGDFLNPETGIL